MKNLSGSAKKKPEFEFIQLKSSDTDGVTFKKSNGEIVLYQVYSDVMSEWLEVPLETVRRVYPNRLNDAQIEVDLYRSKEAAYEKRRDEQVDQDRDDKMSEGA